MGFLSRRHTKKAADASAEPPLSGRPSLIASDTHSSSGRDKDSSSEDQHARSPWALFTTSIIPEPLHELPSWFRTDLDAWSCSSVSSFRSRYPMHSPAGPRWYRNHHLYPPKENPQPSQFSPSFPPMLSGTERSQESIRLPGANRPPSTSPSPTPNSSQLRIMDPNGKVRTRKLSQTDNVDMLDVTDPWGQNWHHESPYDVGLGDRNVVSDSESDPRVRRMSLNANTSRHRTVTPSPLSQSTSALHLNAVDSESPHIPRRLSKRRKPFVGLFSGHSEDGEHVRAKSSSAPPSSATSPLFKDEVARKKTSRRKSTAGLPLTSPSLSSLNVDSDRKEKHGSFMGRLARRLSAMRQPDKGRLSDGIDNGSPNEVAPNADPRPATSGAEASAEPANHEDIRSGGSLAFPQHATPPSLESDSALTTTTPTLNSSQSQSIENRASMGHSVIEAAPMLGNLCIANPDEISASSGASPVVQPKMISESVVVETPKVNGATLTTGEHEATTEVPVEPVPVIVETPASPEMREVPIRDVSVPTTVVEASPTWPPHPASPPPPKIQHSLPLTPKTERPLSMTSDQTIISSPENQTQELPSFIASVSNLASAISVDDPALARVSTIANPPSPRPVSATINPAKLMAFSQHTSESAKHHDESPMKVKESLQHVKSSSATKRRETETFMLVRSPSGSSHQQGEVIMGMGEQWEVVESPTSATFEAAKKGRRKERSGSKERDAIVGGREAKMHRASNSLDETAPQNRRQRSHDFPGEMGVPSSKSTQMPTVDSTHRGYTYDTVSSTRSHARSQLSHRRESEARSTSRHERHASAGAWPSSGVHDYANTTATKDARETDRHWKTRSMTFGADNSVVTSTTIGDSSQRSSLTSSDSHGARIEALTELHRATTLPSKHSDGSLHHFPLHAPYQGSHTIPQVHIPVPPAPIIYSSLPPAQSPSRSGRRRISRSFSGP
ncbi:uncharacterized protein LAESUDRAFT_714546 [Laetiporus sulphureus 93-53]|uniref:Uncharacterized protein n=1 Tax=Laetiporus sulphureus 93-53 TaxID=1314785 RepID=A0A165DXN6_9APHY|nr:uncharacterized protein LAESUDRAFT_714546 [Laetiporus sulphureus 93-53]KZT05832.1 hypothetical protein LAESUDRAFT_714546 [Laetiporus sulphureus 93-53]